MRNCTTAFAATLVASTAIADVLQYEIPIEKFGYLWQLGIPGEESLNSESCVPTSWTNALVYLQNQYETELNGLEMLPSGFEGWTQTVLTLRSAPYMNTNGDEFNPDGTTGYYQVTGIESYVNMVGAAPPTASFQGLSSTAGFTVPPPEDEVFPSWVLEATPTFGQLHRWLEAGEAVVVDIIYMPIDDGIQGHALVLTGLYWDDSNDDNIIQRGEANLWVVDPMDPSESYGADGMQAAGPTKKTFIEVWQDPDDTGPFAGCLQYEYQQYGANQPPSWTGIPFTGQYNIAGGVIQGAGGLNIVGAPLGSCCLSTGCVALTETQCSQVAGNWTLAGSCDDCSELCLGDTDNNGTINIDDLLIVIENWGSCP